MLTTLNLANECAMAALVRRGLHLSILSMHSLCVSQLELLRLPTAYESAHSSLLTLKSTWGALGYVLHFVLVRAMLLYAFSER